MPAAKRDVLFAYGRALLKHVHCSRLRLWFMIMRALPSRQDEAELQESTLVETRLRPIQERCQSLNGGPKEGCGPGR